MLLFAARYSIVALHAWICNMASARIIAAATAAVVAAVVLLGSAEAAPVPDSAGIVEMVNGLAYGGIPYGSISGMLSGYAPAQRQSYYPYGAELQETSASVLLPARTVKLISSPVVGSIGSVGY